jgi:hypothetical protein
MVFSVELGAYIGDMIFRPVDREQIVEEIAEEIIEAELRRYRRWVAGRSAAAALGRIHCATTRCC